MLVNNEGIRQTINAWNDNLSPFFDFITIDELLERIKNGNNTRFEIGREFIPGNDPKFMIESFLADKDKGIKYNDNEHPICILEKSIVIMSSWGVLRH